MAWFRCDLHVHSCLSPCGSLESSPRAVAAAARAHELDLVALTDHNSALNCPAFKAACDELGIACIFGMEVTSAEEAHVLALFEELQTALDFSKELYSRLPDVQVDVAHWGDQVYVNNEEEIEGEVDKLLVSATNFDLETLGSEIQRRGGLFIPAHVDRSAFSLMSQLGFVPPGTYDALEIVRADTTYARLRFKATDLSQGLTIPPLICDSDAHFPEDIALRTFSYETASADEKPSFAGLKSALRNGRIRRHFQRPVP